MYVLVHGKYHTVHQNADGPFFYVKKGKRVRTSKLNFL